MSKEIKLSVAHWVLDRPIFDLDLIADTIKDLLLECSRTTGIFTVTISLPEMGNWESSVPNSGQYPAPLRTPVLEKLKDVCPKCGGKLACCPQGEYCTADGCNYAN